MRLWNVSKEHGQHQARPASATARAMIAAFALAAATPLAAEGGPDPAAVDKLRAALVSAGCILTEGNAAGLLAAAGLSQDDAALVLGRMVDAGEGEMLPDGGFRLNDPACG